MAGILPIWRKTQNNQSIIVQSKRYKIMYLLGSMFFVFFYLKVSKIKFSKFIKKIEVVQKKKKINKIVMSGKKRTMSGLIAYYIQRNMINKKKRIINANFFSF